MIYLAVWLIGASAFFAQQAVFEWDAYERIADDNNQALIFLFIASTFWFILGPIYAYFLVKKWFF